MSDLALAPSAEPRRNAKSEPVGTGSAPEPVVADYPVPDSWRSLEELPNAPRPLPRPAAFPDAPPSRPKLLTARTAVVFLALLALVQGAIIARLLTAEVKAPPIPLTIASSGSSAAVTVDGRDVGVTPLRLTVDESVHEIRLTSLQPPPTLTAPAALPSPPPEPPAPLVRSGGLAITSPIEVQLVEGNRVLGSSADGSVVMTAGVHQLELVNSAFGYRERRTVEVKSGQVIPLLVKPPDGRLNINALPWAQVWIDGKQAGETPLANVSVPVGQHEVVFRHPELGERRETTLVKSGAVTRISVTLSR